MVGRMSFDGPSLSAAHLCLLGPPRVYNFAQLFERQDRETFAPARQDHELYDET